MLYLDHAAGRVMVFVAWYGSQHQNAELINSQNVLVAEKDPVWRNLLETNEMINLGDRQVAVRQALLHAPARDERLLVWYWRHIDGRDSTNIFKGKLALAWSKLSGRGDTGSAILIAEPYRDKQDKAEPVLKAFLQDARPGLNHVLDLGSERP